MFLSVILLHIDKVKITAKINSPLEIRHNDRTFLSCLNIINNLFSWGSKVSSESDGQSTVNTGKISRRPIKARDTKWAAATARWLTNSGLRPNHISVLSVFFAAIAGTALLFTAHVDANWSRALLYLLAIAGIQFRLLCNLFDGMVAVEGGFRSKTGELFNEFPDRISDVIILLGAGYACGPYGTTLGWIAAVLAVLTAYVRALGGSAGVSQAFCGPMAKQQRMAIITLACILGSAEDFLTGTRWVMPIALVLVASGCVVTIVRRLNKIAAEMRLQ